MDKNWLNRRSGKANRRQKRRQPSSLLARKQPAERQDKATAAELEKLLSSANNASGPARNAWLAFLGLLAYLLITLAGITDEDLLRNSPVTLPIVSVSIPLFSFFLTAPVLFLLVHLGLLIQHAMLSNKYQHFSSLIEEFEEAGTRDHPDRRLVHNYVFSQMIAGATPPLLLQLLMRAMVFTTLTLLPILVLLYFQIKFLPYHEVLITHAHRSAVFLDLALLFIVQPFNDMPYLVRHGRKLRLGNKNWRWEFSYVSLGVAGSLSIAAFLFSLLVATVPQACAWPFEERFAQEEEPCFSFDRMTANWWSVPVGNDVSYRTAFAPTALLFETHWLSRNLQLSDKTLLSEGLSTDVLARYDLAGKSGAEALKALSSGLNLKGRDLQYANFSKTRFYNVDLRQANLQGANFMESNLQGATLFEANMRGANFEDARLQGTILSGAKMQGASFRHANLQRAKLVGAELQGADFLWSQMQGANLREAYLQGASFDGAQLQGAVLANTNLQGANLSNANLQGASLLWASLQEAILKEAILYRADLRETKFQDANLERAQLQGANLRGIKFQGASLKATQLKGAVLEEANFQGANLEEANLQGANLNAANLQAANLRKTKLQGASLKGAQLQGAYLISTQLQGANLTGASLQGANLNGANVWQALPPDAAAIKFSAPWVTMESLTARDKSALEKLISETKEAKLRKQLHTRLGPLMDEAKSAKWRYSPEGRTWFSYYRSRFLEKDRINYLIDFTCKDRTGRYLVKAIDFIDFRLSENQLATLDVQRLLSTKNCPAAAYLNDKTAEKLKEIAASQKAGHDPKTD